MTQVQQASEIDTTTIAHTCHAISQAKHEIAAINDQVGQLRNGLLEKKNWLLGHQQLNEEDLKARRLLQTHNEYKREVQMLEAQIAEKIASRRKIEQDLRDLESINFSTDHVMAKAVADYRDSLAKVEALQGQESALLKEKAIAETTLGEANLVLRKAQEAKKQSLSLSDISKASEEELAAKRRVDELDALVKNLNDALRPIPGQLTVLKSVLSGAEAMVWNAKLEHLLHLIKENPEFSPAFEFIEMALAAWVKAGRSPSVALFLKETLVDGKLVRADTDSMTAQQAAMASEMGLTG